MGTVLNPPADGHAAGWQLDSRTVGRRVVLHLRSGLQIPGVVTGFDTTGGYPLSVALDDGMVVHVRPDAVDACEVPA